MNWLTPPREPVWLAPPHLEPWRVAALALARARAPVDPQLVWVMSSGTTGVDQVKVFGLTRTAILNSAAAVNRHLGATDADHWLRTIPEYHVGGLSIHARAHLSGARVSVMDRWDARAFAASECTLSALVPTQIYDLVALKLRAPNAVRAVVVGGGALDPELYRAARTLGWPILPSYGLTETASQVATATLDGDPGDFPDLEVLDHAEIKIIDDVIRIKATSLARWRLVVSGEDVVIDDPRDDGWILTEDLGMMINGRLRVTGRRDDVVKILGVLVPINAVEAELSRFIGAAGADPARAVVLTRPDARRGVTLAVVSDQTESLERLARAVDLYNSGTIGPRRIDHVVWTPEIPRTALGKVRKVDLRRRLSFGPV